jgi:hypothetical protein
VRSSAEREVSPACAAALGSLAANPASEVRHDSDVARDFYTGVFGLVESEGPKEQDPIQTD